MKRVSLLPLGLFVHLAVAQAEVDFPCDTDQGVVVVFVNGMDVDRESARSSMIELERNLRAYLSGQNQEKLTFRFAYNNTHGKVLDFLEAARQNNTEDREVSLREVYGVDQPSSESPMLGLYANDTEETIVSDGDLTRHLALYREWIEDKKKRVVAVCHSQGNFFCNAAWRILNENPSTEHLSSNSFRPVGVANPSSLVASNGYNTTRDDDKVINAVRIAARIGGIDPPMPSTITGDVATDDWSRHRFIKTYLYSISLARTDMLMNTAATIDSAEWPSYIPPAFCFPTPEPVTHTACNDGIDNDSDGRVDWNGGNANQPPDPGCINPDDTSEFNIGGIGEI